MDKESNEISELEETEKTKKKGKLRQEIKQKFSKNTDIVTQKSSADIRTKFLRIYLSR